MRVCVGGTFDFLHKGHRILLEKAFEVAGEDGLVFIGITTENAIQKKTVVKSFYERKHAIECYLMKKKLIEKAIIVPIYDKYGLTLQEDFDAIVVSPETMNVAKEINEKRKKLGRKTMKIIRIPFVLAEDNIPISSQRIRKKEIDIDGKLNSLVREKDE
jgi:pantetheine-phosphate adenylyltransferase